MAPDEAQPHKRKSGEANNERELNRAHDSRHLDRNRNRSVSDPDDDIPLKILKYTGESRPTLQSFPEATFATSPQPTHEWVDVVRAAVANGHSPPSNFPWTIQFVKTLHNSLSHYQRGLDRVGFNNRKGLPIDPDTKDWESVQRKFPPFEGY
ncbi:hypothetical protein NW760_008345 [Fusarium oxysporum]|nr:hypothetical protein NW760_008345 [Fusarium oxysporum]